MDYYKMKRMIYKDVLTYLENAQEGNARPFIDFRNYLVGKYGATDKLIKSTFELHGLTINENDEVVKYEP